MTTVQDFFCVTGTFYLKMNFSFRDLQVITGLEFSQALLSNTGGSVFRGVPGLAVITQQDRAQMSPTFELKLTYVEIYLGCHGKTLVGTFKGFSRRGTPWEDQAAMARFWGQKH